MSPESDIGVFAFWFGSYMQVAIRPFPQFPGDNHIALGQERATAIGYKCAEFFIRQPTWQADGMAGADIHAKQSFLECLGYAVIYCVCSSHHLIYIQSGFSSDLHQVLQRQSRILGGTRL